MSGHLNGRAPHDDAGLPITFEASPRRASDPDEEDWRERRHERRVQWRDPPPPQGPAPPPWINPSTLFGGLALLLSIAAPLVGIYPRLTALETRIQAQGEIISDLRQQIGSLSSVDASIAQIQGQLNSLTGRLDAQRQTLTAIESALMERADRPRQLPMSGR